MRWLGLPADGIVVNVPDGLNDPIPMEAAEVLPWLAVDKVLAPPIRDRARRVSGRYVGVGATVRLDVDGESPLLHISGTLPDGRSLDEPLERVGVVQHGAATWWVYSGPSVEVGARVDGDHLRLATAAGTHELDRVSTGFRDLTVDVHFQEDVEYPLEVATAVDGEPAPRTVDLARMLGRAGVSAQVRASPIRVDPGLDPNADGWDDIELHDAMVRQWEAADAGAGWRMFLLAADSHVSGPSIGGRMFDGPDAADDPLQRQGAALFSSALMFDPTFAHIPGTPKTVQQGRFFRLFVALHEIGHVFDLDHPWDRNGADDPWRPTGNDREAHTWMNYAWSRPEAFHQSFAFEYDPAELRFLRHAPDDKVRMGGRRWSSDSSAASVEPFRRRLTRLRRQANRSRHGLALELPAEVEVDYLAPVVLVGLLRNNSDVAVAIPHDGVALSRDSLVVAVRGPTGVGEVRPYVSGPTEWSLGVLEPGEALEVRVYVSSTPGVGWLFTSPGRYRVAVFVRLPGGRAVARAVVAVTVGAHEALPADTPPPVLESYGRLHAFEGSRLEAGRTGEALSLLARVSRDGAPSARQHAELVLASPFSKSRRVLDVGGRLSLAAADRPRAVLGLNRFLALDDDATARHTAVRDPVLWSSVVNRLAALDGLERGDAVRDLIELPELRDRVLVDRELLHRRDVIGAESVRPPMERRVLERRSEPDVLEVPAGAEGLRRPVDLRGDLRAHVDPDVLRSLLVDRGD